MGQLSRFSHVKPGPQQTRFVDFDADDSGAMQHVIPEDPHEDFLVAFTALIAAPWPVGRHDMKTVAAA